jgi:hypothetical protein
MTKVPLRLFLAASLLVLSLTRVAPADAQGSLADSLFQGMAKGVGGRHRPAAGRLGLTAIGLGNSNGQLTEISDQLSEILGLCSVHGARA